MKKMLEESAPTLHYSEKISHSLKKLLMENFFLFVQWLESIEIHVSIGTKWVKQIMTKNLQSKFICLFAGSLNVENKKLKIILIKLYKIFV